MYDDYTSANMNNQKNQANPFKWCLRSKESPYQYMSTAGAVINVENCIRFETKEVAEIWFQNEYPDILVYFEPYNLEEEGG